MYFVYLVNKYINLKIILPLKHRGDSKPVIKAIQNISKATQRVRHWVLWKSNYINIEFLKKWLFYLLLKTFSCWNMWRVYSVAKSCMTTSHQFMIQQVYRFSFISKYNSRVFWKCSRNCFKTHKYGARRCGSRL